MQIRLSVREDASSMVELEHLVWTPGTTPGNIHFDSEAEFLLKNPPGSKVVVVKEDKVIGILGYKSPIPLPSNKHVVELDIAVHPDYQREGIGQLLMDKMKEIAREKATSKSLCAFYLSIKEPFVFMKRTVLNKRDYLKKNLLLMENL